MIEQPQTPIPYPFIETIKKGKSQLIGWVGSISEDGVAAPESGAYIYVYLNGILINPPVVDKYGQYINLDKVISDANGYWSSDNFILDVHPGYQTGNAIYFKAKGIGKTLSEKSIPHMIGGMPSPLALGVYSQFNYLRAPYEDEASLMGRTAYWRYKVPHLLPYVEWYERNNLSLSLLGSPIFGCNTALHVYSDGINIGKVEDNRIIGKDAVYPLIINRDNAVDIRLTIGGAPYTIPMSSFISEGSYNATTEAYAKPIDMEQPIAIPYQDMYGVDTVYYSLPIKSDNEYIKLYKNGMRLVFGEDYNLTVDPDNKAYYKLELPILLANNDLLVAVYQPSATNFVFQEKITLQLGIVDYSVSKHETYIIGTLAIYNNGVRLTKEIDYQIVDRAIHFLFPLSPDENSVYVDYQMASAVIRPLSYPLVVTVAGNTATVVTPVSFGISHIFVNGVYQTLRTDYSTARAGASLTFTFGTDLTNELVTVEYAYYPVYLSEVITAINGSGVLSGLCTYAAEYIPAATEEAYVEELPILIDTRINDFYYYIEPKVLDYRLAVYKNGLRMFPGRDYTLIPIENRIMFYTLPDITDILTATVFNNPEIMVINERVERGNSNTFTLASPMQPDGFINVYVNGIKTEDFIVVGQEVTVGHPLVQLDMVYVDYQKQATTMYASTDVNADIVIDTVRNAISLDTASLKEHIVIYKNGLKQKETIDYVISGSNAFFFTPIVSAQDVFSIDYYQIHSTRYTYSRQLQLVSKNTMELASSSFFFGTVPYLFPGKDAQGNFLFYFKQTDGTWKYTNLDQTELQKEIIKYVPFVTGQHITARLLDTSAD